MTIITTYLRAMAKDLMVNWKKPSWSEEFKEMERTSEELGVPIILLKKSFEQGNMMQPLKSLLKSMENTDYNEVKTIEDVKRFADEYERNSDAIIDGFKQGKPMAAPIVALRKGKRPYLISGNTRLMVSKALEIIPELYVINL